MAEKKFFVDINLQSNALTNATIGTNSSLTKAGSFGFDGTRLKYFDGSAIKEVANLTDIAAVTGGLILQGGYNAATNTPDIAADSSVLKGFFWVVTAAGSFLGEAVQVGDSIIAKQDNPGATAANWLILQGNVVIATDSVDGISRLATQAEADAGTEGGAVVITPATLQGKIDAQVTPAINDKVSKSGDTMSGNLNMGNNSITNVNEATVTTVRTFGLNSIDGPGGVINVAGTLIMNGGLISDLGAPTAGSDAANKTYVDDNTSNKLPLAGGTMSGDIHMGNNVIDNVGYAQINDLAVDRIAADNSNNPIILLSDLNADSGFGLKTIINLPAPINGGDAANKQYVDDQDALKLSLTGGTMSGTIDMNGEELLSASISNSALTTDLFANDNRITSLLAPINGGDAANKTYVDDNTNNKLPLAGGTMTGNINFSGIASITNLTGISVDNISATDPGYSIFISNPLNFNDTNLPTGLTAPTNGSDATNKTYVDNAASTAESNANAYTDTRVDAQSYRVELASGDWTLNGSTYEAIVTHNLNSSYPVVTFTDSNEDTVELIYTAQSAFAIVVKSNILPTVIGVSLVAVN